MLTQYAIEVMVKDRLREVRKELMTRQALREAYGEQGKRLPLFRKLRCRLSRFLAGIWSWNNLLIQPIELPRKENPCLDVP